MTGEVKYQFDDDDVAEDDHNPVETNINEAHTVPQNGSGKIR